MYRLAIDVKGMYGMIVVEAPSYEECLQKAKQMVKNYEAAGHAATILPYAIIA